MKSTVETLSPTRVRLEIEVPFAELEPSLKKAYREIGQQVSIPGFRRALRLARLPWPLRRLGMWLGLHASGRLRERFFGTFSLSSPAAQGAGMLSLITAHDTLSLGLIDHL